MPDPSDASDSRPPGPGEVVGAAGASDPSDGLVQTTASGQGADQDLDPHVFARRLQAEIEAEAAALRRARPDIARLEREAGRQWEAIAQLGDDAEPSQRLLRLAGRLAFVDADAPLGTRAGVRQVKGAVRRLVHWYLRHLADQLNGWHDVVVRWMNRTDDRIRAAEEALGLTPLSIPGAGAAGGPGPFGLADLIGAAPDLPEAAADEIAAAVAGAIGRGAAAAEPTAAGGSAGGAPVRAAAAAGPTAVGGPVAVLGCAEGAVVAALGRAGLSAYGVDRDPERIAAGVADGLDLRRDDPLSHLRGLAEGDLAGAVLIGFVEDLAAGAAAAAAAAVTGAVRVPGAAVVVAADPAAREPVQRDLRAGRGLAPATWAHLLERAGWTVSRRPTAAADEAAELILARRP